MLFTEFAENGSVFDYIFKECKQPSPSQILLWATQVAEGIAVADQSHATYTDVRLMLLYQLTLLTWYFYKWI